MDPETNKDTHGQKDLSRKGSSRGFLEPEFSFLASQEKESREECKARLSPSRDISV